MTEDDVNAQAAMGRDYDTSVKDMLFGEATRLLWTHLDGAINDVRVRLNTIVDDKKLFNLVRGRVERGHDKHDWACFQPANPMDWDEETKEELLDAITYMMMRRWRNINIPAPNVPNVEVLEGNCWW